MGTQEWAGTVQGSGRQNRQLRAVLVALGLLGVAAVATQAIVSGFARLQPVLGLGDSFALTFAVGGLLATSSYVALAVLYRRVHPVVLHVPWRRPTSREGGWVLGGVVVLIAVALGIDLLAAVVNAGEATPISAAAAVENPVLVYSVFLVANLVFIAPAEELLFRGVIQGRLRESVGPGLAIGVTAIGFAVSHLPSYWLGGSELLSVGVLLALVTIASAGLVLGAIYERTQNLLVVSLVHGLANAVGIVLVLATLL
jgi:membrane protease YdiL (CAAX protease family)